MVVVACNQPNLLTLPFRLELIRPVASSARQFLRFALLPGWGIITAVGPRNFNHQYIHLRSFIIDRHCMFSSRPTECFAGDEALDRGAWVEARTAFEGALCVRELREALEGLGTAGWWLDLADLVFEARERAYRLYLARDDRAAAARIAVWLAWDYWAFRGENAVANRWLQRARHLLEEQPACSERAWLEVREGSLCLLEEVDPTRAQALAAEGINPRGWRLRSNACEHESFCLYVDAGNYHCLVRSGSGGVQVPESG